MLGFWYSSRCSREIKLISSISVCIGIYLCSTVAALAALWVALSLFLGMLTNVLYTYSLRLKPTDTYQNILRNVIYIIQFFALCSLAYLLPVQHKWIYWLQCLGFDLIGLFLVSIYSNRATRHDQPDE